MTTPPPPAIKEHRYAISDERIAQLYSATEPQDCAMLMFHRDDVLGLLDRLDAAEARLAQATRFKPDQECATCEGTGTAVRPTGFHWHCACTEPGYVEVGGK